MASRPIHELTGLNILTSQFGVRQLAAVLVARFSRALVYKLVVKYAGTILQDSVGYDIFKIWENLFPLQEERDNMFLGGIQSEQFCKICSGLGDKKTSGVDAEKELGKGYGTRSRIRLDHQIQINHASSTPKLFSTTLLSS